jgi:hypothetical protein
LRKQPGDFFIPFVKFLSIFFIKERLKRTEDLYASWCHHGV